MLSGVHIGCKVLYAVGKDSTREQVALAGHDNLMEDAVPRAIRLLFSFAAGRPKMGEYRTVMNYCYHSIGNSVV